MHLRETKWTFRLVGQDEAEAPLLEIDGIIQTGGDRPLLDQPERFARVLAGLCGENLSRMQATAPVGTRLRTIPETAEQLHLSPRMVERPIADGELAPVRIGRAVRLPDTEIERFIRALQNDHDSAANGAVGKERDATAPTAT